MLKRTTQTGSPLHDKWAHLSLILVGLMWVFPFLYYRHENPLTTFDQEWWSAMLGTLAMTLLVTREFWREPDIPRIAQLPAALIVVLMLQLVLGKIAYFNQALLYALYLLFAMLLMILGARLRRHFGLPRLATVLAVFLLVGAELGAVIGILQHFQWHTPLDAVVILKISSGLYGNIGQPNQYADYVALGLISLGLLFQQRKLKPAYTALLASPLLFVMTLSGSRSSLLFMGVMVVLAWWLSRREKSLRPLLWYSGMLVVGSGLMYLLAQTPFMGGVADSTTNVQRLLAPHGPGGTGGIRLYLWREAVTMFAQSPMLGVGFGQFAWHHFQMVPELQPKHIVGLYNNAHNLFLQLAAETGIFGLLTLIGSVGVWLSGLRRATFSGVHWWGYSMLGVLAIHSLLEYPLWYAYFIAIAAVLLGVFDETHYRLEFRLVGRASLAVMILLGLLSLVQMRIGYQQLKHTLALRPAAGDVAETYPLLREGLIRAHAQPLLSPYAEMYMLSLTEISPDQIRQKIALGANVMHFVPIGPVVYREAFFLAQDGELAQAKQLLKQAIWSYPADEKARQVLNELAAKDPEHFSPLLEFAVQTEQERARAIHQ